MNLNYQQINYLFSFIHNQGVSYYDVQVELVDHMAARIEAEMEMNPSLLFQEVVDNAYAAFGPHGFQKILQEKKEATTVQFKKTISNEITEWFTFQRLTLILIVGSVTYSMGSHLPVLLRFYAVIGAFLILTAYQLIRIACLSRKKQNKKLLLLEKRKLLFLLTTLISPLIVLAITHDQFSRQAETMVGIVLVAFIYQVTFYNVYKKVTKQAQKLYPDAFI